MCVFDETGKQKKTERGSFLKIWLSPFLSPLLSSPSSWGPSSSPFRSLSLHSLRTLSLSLSFSTLFRNSLSPNSFSFLSSNKKQKVGHKRPPRYRGITSSLKAFFFLNQKAKKRRAIGWVGRTQTHINKTTHNDGVVG